jgi:hypothetical protein
MKKLIYIAALCGLAACSKSNKEWVVELENPLDIARVDESFVITRAQLAPVDQMWPAVVDANGSYVASQVDDLDGDGVWDELAFVTNLGAKESASLKVVWVAEADYPKFTVRTNVRCGVMRAPGVIEDLKRDMRYREPVYFINTEGYPYQMDGVAWENDKVGWRHYYDGRNSRDYFGKRVADMVLDTVGIKPDGTPGDTYHVWAEWGRDIMSVSTSYGLGGIGGLLNDTTFVRMGRLATDSANVIDSTEFVLMAEGPVRSRFAFNVYGWDVEGSKVNIDQEVTIWAGQYGYENKVAAKNLPADVTLVTGLVKNFNDKEMVTIKSEKGTVMATHDMQSYDKEFWFGMGVLIPNDNLAGFDLPTTGELNTTWAAKLKLVAGEAFFKAYGAWEYQDTMFRNRDFFMNLMTEEGRKFDQPVKLTMK